MVIRFEVGCNTGISIIITRVFTLQIHIHDLISSPTSFERQLRMYYNCCFTDERTGLERVRGLQRSHTLLGIARAGVTQVSSRCWGV